MDDCWKVFKDERLSEDRPFEKLSKIKQPSVAL